MTYTVSSGTLNSSIPYHTILLVIIISAKEVMFSSALVSLFVSRIMQTHLTDFRKIRWKCGMEETIIFVGDPHLDRNFNGNFYHFCHGHTLDEWVIFNEFNLHATA